MSDEKDYVLGTHDEEISRLALQHRVWRPRALDAWRRAGFASGRTILDVGCGPGYASLDLAEIVGPSGAVIALDRSRRFLGTLEAASYGRGLGNVRTVELDLDEGEFPPLRADGAWARWVLAFVWRPRDLLARIAAALKPGGAIVLHEYFHYATWQLAPRSAEHEEFVRTVMETWRASGGEPDVGLDVPRWLGEVGFETREVRPILEIVSPRDPLWQWPKSFIGSGLRRLVELGRLTPERAESISRAFAAAEASPGCLMVTPGVLEVIAVRR